MQKAIAELIQEHLGMTYSQAMNSTDLIINALDPQERIVFWNKKSENYFGVNKEWAMGKKLSEIAPYTLNHEKMKYVYDALKGETVIIEKEKYMKRTAYYSQKIIPVVENGKVIAALNIVTDIR